ncbi:hypothetical protein BYT27DRAFT_7115818 [Phlegmacium glaucopus]|nr:hypothetical protein BYT27DRAFT_7115818 [Phlegmacium glaucopus]
MWDDTSEYWDGYSNLVICGTPIPVSQWKKVFEGAKTGPWKSKHWEGLKKRHFEWKCLVKRWRKSSEEEFWKEFSDEGGHRLTYTAIITRLAKLRADEDARLAEKAKAEYGEAFASHFSYRKGGVMYVKTKAADIAKQYRELCGIDN